MWVIYLRIILLLKVILEQSSFKKKKINVDDFHS